MLSAENGMHALQSVATSAAIPALILLDLAMPVMDGWAFLSQIPSHAQLASVPIIVMSADARAQQLGAGRLANVTEILPKPIDIGHMMELVRKHTGEISPG